MARLKAYKDPLRDSSNLKKSLKDRQAIFMNQTGKGFWKGMHDLCQCVF